MPIRNEGSARPVGAVGASRSIAKPNATGSPDAPPPSRADRLAAIMMELGFDPANWGDAGSPYTVETLGPDRTILQIQMPDRRVHVGVGADLEGAIADIEAQLTGGAR
jgi:hypothetical protein